MTPQQQQVYDNYLGWFLTTLKWATDAKAIPLDDLDVVVGRLRLSSILVTPANDRIHLSSQDIQEHEKLFELVKKFRADYLEWEAEAKGGMSSGIILPN